MPGDVLGYRLSVTNTAPATLTGAVVTDNLADVLDDAGLGALPAGAGLAGTTLTWNVPPVAAGATVTLDYAATVKAGALGVTLRNTAAPASVGGACAASCVTSAHTPAWTLTKTSDPGDGATVVPGSTITYSLTAANTSDAEITGATAPDDLSGVLGGARVTADSSELALDGTLLTWTIPTLAAHETRTVTYTARVAADGATITNTVTPVGVGGTCAGLLDDGPHGCVDAGEVRPTWQTARSSCPATPALHADRHQHRPGDLSGALVSDDV